MVKAIEVLSLEKSYGKKKVLEGIDLEIEEGKIYGLLGRNGAGKTTLLNLISDRIFREGGEIKVYGKEVHENEEALRNICFISDNSYMVQSMKGKEFFKWLERFYSDFDMEYAKSLAEKFGLNLNESFSKLSLGYKTIYKIIGSLATNAKITIYDEPVLGLDVNHRDLFYKELLKNYSKNNNTVIVSTHLIEEISSILEMAIMIDGGQVIIQDNVEQILEKSFKIEGTVDAVDKVIKGKNIIFEEIVLGKKKAIVYEKLSRDIEGVGIEKVKLQDLYLAFTNK